MVSPNTCFLGSSLQKSPLREVPCPNIDDVYKDCYNAVEEGKALLHEVATGHSVDSTNDAIMNDPSAHLKREFSDIDDFDNTSKDGNHYNHL